MSRLSPVIRPSEYSLALKLDPGRDTFDGEVAIRVRAGAEEALVLHAEGLTIQAAWVDEQPVAVEPAGPDAIALGRLAQGEHTVRLTYQGGVNPRLRGLYRSLDSEQRPLLVTQMEPNYARLVFPCFDEPAFKAVFRLSVEAPAGLCVLSNSARERVEGNRTDFAPTPPMSTYLVAVVVGPLEVGAEREVDGLKVRIVATPGKQHLCQFAADVTAYVLKDYREYFGVAYPGTKLDLIGVPDFGSGAMENLGAIVFREMRLLVDPDRASRDALHSVAETVAHEVAHQWFGDLVTMDWWEDLWLNEAFASWMEVRVVEKMRPEWHPWLNFGRLREEAMELDGLSSSRPVYAPVENPNQMAEMFDLITYVKGASVLKMLEEFLGPDLFQQGVAAYIAEHAFKNARGEDLWRALSQVSGHDVTALTTAWLTRPGYPLLSVSRTEAGLEVEQERFLYSGPVAAEPWPVPLWVVYPDRVERVLLTERRGVYPGALRLRNEHGYYRLFDPAGPEADLSALERMHRGMDRWALVKAGRETFSRFLELLESEEREERVWEAYLVALRELCLIVGPNDHLTRVLRLAAGRLESSALRAALGTFGQDQSQVPWAREAEERPLDRPAALRVLNYWGDEAAFEREVGRWRAESDPDQSFLRLVSLGWFRSDACLEKVLNLVLHREVRPQDGGHVLKELLMHRAGRAVAWPFITANWDQLVEILPMQGMRLILQGAAYLIDQAGVSEFLTPRPVEGGNRLLAQSLEQLAVRRALLERSRQVTA